MRHVLIILVCLRKYPHVEHYADAVQLIWGKFGYELTGAMFVLFLVLITGSHTLTGTIAFIRISDEPALCALIWGIISAIVLFFVALPPTFAEFAILGYVDFGSIIVAIIVTMVSTGVHAHNSAGGLSGVNWTMWYVFPGRTCQACRSPNSCRDRCRRKAHHSRNRTQDHGRICSRQH